MPKITAVFLLVFVVLPYSQPVQAASTSDNVALRWNNAALAAIRNTRPGPTVTARALAILHTAMYDAWSAYDPTAVGTRLGFDLSRPVTEYSESNKITAVSIAAYRVLTDLFPAQTELFSKVLTDLGYDPAAIDSGTSIVYAVGNLAADALLKYRHHDGANQLGDLHAGAYSDYTGYMPFNTEEHPEDLSHWQPLQLNDNHNGMVTQQFLTPHWRRVRPFALDTARQFRPVPPMQYAANSAEFRRQAEEILILNANLDDRRKTIVEYWADGPNSETPSGHWCVLAQFISARDGHQLDDDIKLFFILSNALFDASIAAWDAKRAYDYVRPITAIRTLFRGRAIEAWGGPFQGAKTIQGENWLPYQSPATVTPPFPEYVSGHSTFSMAAATVLKHYTGSDRFDYSVRISPGSSKIEPGQVPATAVTLHFATFTEAAKQAGRSRLLGGIHFAAGDREGRKLGRKVGELVWERGLHYIKGRPDQAVGCCLARPVNRMSTP